jgi:hypothetical protein
LSATAKRVAIVQSNYIPWKGYFDLINSVDEFILLDEVQYTRRDWRNRNRIKTPQGVIWLTIPVNVKGRYEQRIDETTVSDPSWAEKHWQTLHHSYASALHFDDFSGPVQAAYLGLESDRLSDINRHMLEAVSGMLGIDTPLRSSTDYEGGGRKTERLLGLCLAAGAAEYVSGPAAKAYLDESAFHAAGVEVSYFDYGGYPEYEQPYPPFEHSVSVLDLIFSTGKDARNYMKSFSATAADHA